MRRKFIAPLMILAMAAVGLTGNTAHAQTHPKKKTAKAAFKAPTAADIEQGKGLLAKSDCLACHKVDMKIVGPAYKEVAAKYPPTEANYKLLTQKIIKGGGGVWASR